MPQELGCRNGRQITFQEPFDCEPRLEPGSIVVGGGHTYIFLGYAQDPRDVRKLGVNKAPYRIVTLEAEGNLVRSVGVFFRVMPYEKSKNAACRMRKYTVLKLNSSAI